MRFAGVTVKLIPPNIESVNTTIPGTAKFTEKVFPEDSLTQEDPTSVGFTFTKSEDPSVDRYGMFNTGIKPSFFQVLSGDKYTKS